MFGILDTLKLSESRWVFAGIQKFCYWQMLVSSTPGLETLKAEGQGEETATSQFNSQPTGWNFSI